MDLAYCDCECKASRLLQLGTSDHFTISLAIDLSLNVPAPPPGRAVYHLSSAPWNHMCADIKRQFEGWDAHTYISVDGAVVSFYGVVDAIIKKDVKSSIPRSARPVPWWDRHCTIAQKGSGYDIFKVGT